MCASTIYWANIGRVVYGASNEMLDELVGVHPENLTIIMRGTCREIFKGGKKDIQVIGPVEGVSTELIELSAVHCPKQSP
jgi:tRNA(Arg) A34 adenosine deaminase TadA